ncbi:hypothetical protein AMAG_12209 [Allomyces macrogynus ATCC 38327]|uniref:RCC1-like domain-containing protein n=1 Tax=Allomyces macrogynus (strain ATCC 38327) TaxID=578462 RepID=A0A0L0SXC1_ALLM3|nr:hypothetical protein AMAG_12209 [Allomyces macrogynus ATCC 38327]|eukprot:KNE67136.1 hypothetical protein AMAG_12209 [Allomyces macrogynus ATCC 38327]
MATTKWDTQHRPPIATPVLITWGANTHGQLATGATLDEPLPVITNFPPDATLPLRTIQGGANHTLLVDRAGRVFAAGSNHDSQLGTAHDSETTATSTWIALALFPHPVNRVACGWAHSAAVTEYGDLYVWGDNSSAQCDGLRAEKQMRTPVLVDLGTRVVRVACGLRHTATITAAGDLYMWGANRHGQCGTGTTSTVQATPYRVPTGARVVDVACGSHHTIALLETGTVVAFGHNKFGQLGVPIVEPGIKHVESSPLVVPLPPDARPERVFACWTTSAIVTVDRRLFLFGRAHADSQWTKCATPTEMDVGGPVDQFVLGSEHCVAVVRDRLVAWGWNEHGNCGVVAPALELWRESLRGAVAVEKLDLPNVFVPTDVAIPSEMVGKRVVLIGGGYAHTMAVLE